MHDTVPSAAAAKHIATNCHVGIRPQYAVIVVPPALHAATHSEYPDAFGCNGSETEHSLCWLDVRPDNCTLSTSAGLGPLNAIGSSWCTWATPDSMPNVPKSRNAQPPKSVLGISFPLTQAAIFARFASLARSLRVVQIFSTCPRMQRGSGAFRARS